MDFPDFYWEAVAVAEGRTIPAEARGAPAPWGPPRGGRRDQPVSGRESVAADLELRGAHRRVDGVRVLRRAVATDGRRRARAAVRCGPWSSPSPVRRSTTRTSLRLLGGLHYVVLGGDEPELAAHYPSTGGDGDAAAAWPRIRALLAQVRPAGRGGVDRTAPDQRGRSVGRARRRDAHLRRRDRAPAAPAGARCECRAQPACRPLPLRAGRVGLGRSRIAASGSRISGLPRSLRSTPPSRSPIDAVAISIRSTRGVATVRAGCWLTSGPVRRSGSPAFARRWRSRVRCRCPSTRRTWVLGSSGSSRDPGRRRGHRGVPLDLLAVPAGVRRRAGGRDDRGCRGPSDASGRRSDGCGSSRSPTELDAELRLRRGPVATDRLLATAGFHDGPVQWLRVIQTGQAPGSAVASS